MHATITEMKPNISDHELAMELDAHELWLRTDGQQGRRASLRGARLAAKNLQHCNLIGADLARADLRYVDISNGVLRGADLTDANLHGAYLDYADFTHSKLPISIRSCQSFRHAQFSPDALPWLVLHPNWPEMRDSVQIIDC